MRIKWKKLRDDIVTASVVIIVFCAWILALILLHIYLGWYGDIIGWIGYCSLVIFVSKGKIIRFLFGRWIDFDDDEQ